MKTPTRKPCTRASIIGALLLAGALALPGCAGSSENRQDQPDARADRPAAPAIDAASRDRSQELDAFLELGYRIEWRGFPFYGSNLRVQFFDVYNDAIVVQDDSSTVTVMDPVSGRNRWSTRLAGNLTRFVGNARRGNDLLSASDTTLYVVDIRTGTINDKHRLAVVVNTPPTVNGSMAIFGSSSGELLGHNLISGYKQWGYLLNGAITAHPVNVGRGVGAVSGGGDVLIVDPVSGESIGRALIFDGLENHPVAGADTLFVASRDQSVYAFDATNGARIWRHRTQRPITAQPAAHDGRLYVVIPRRGLVAFNGATGEILWEAEGVAGEPIAMRDRRLIVWNGAVATVIDDRRGDIIDTIPIDDVALIETTQFVGGDIYVVEPTGAVAKYVPID